MNGIKQFCVVLSTFLILKSEYTDCLKIESRIVSGYSTKPAQFPWQAILKKTRRGGLHGAGTLISEDWVLTASHCIYGLNSIFVIFGTIFWRDVGALAVFSKDLYPHPKYNTTHFHNDIGLIKLKRALQFNKYIQPIPLVSNAYEDYDFIGTRCIITGFGYIHDNIPNPFGDLLGAEVIIISNDECARSYEDNIIDSSMCSIGAYSSNKAICEGDSGGPLITRDPYGNLIQIGVISFSAEETCDKNYPSAFARVSSFLDFISQTTNLTWN